METAINIGFACSLLREDMLQYTLSASSPRIEELERAGEKEQADVLAAEQVAKQLLKMEASLYMSGKLGGSSKAATNTTPVGRAASGASSTPPKTATTTTTSSPTSSPLPPPDPPPPPPPGPPEAALIVDGKALAYALSKDLAPAFLRVGLRCKAVLCCRVSPLQKAQVTSLVRSDGRITLAVGDGANDVGMIQRAHIGVGISGQEGMQAVMSSDFAIAQFRYLVPLLLVHGRYSYKRITRMVLFFFYKNMLFSITLFTYSAFTTFSGSYIYNDTSMTLFNVVFTSATPL
ncbi:hypothetical protein Agub_g4001, partial [Astrephomene gubernaculifera]